MNKEERIKRALRVRNGEYRGAVQKELVDRDGKTKLSGAPVRRPSVDEARQIAERLGAKFRHTIYPGRD